MHGGVLEFGLFTFNSSIFEKFLCCTCKVNSLWRSHYLSSLASHNRFPVLGGLE